MAEGPPCGDPRPQALPAEAPHPPRVRSNTCLPLCWPPGHPCLRIKICWLIGHPCPTPAGPPACAALRAGEALPADAPHPPRAPQALFRSNPLELLPAIPYSFFPKPSCRFHPDPRSCPPGPVVARRDQGRQHGQTRNESRVKGKG